MRKSLVATAITAIVGLACASANAGLLPVTINETLLGVGTHITTDVGKLNGGYTETLTVNSDLSFSSTAFGDIGQLYNTAGSQISTLVGSNTTGLNSQYAMYAIFNSDGFISSPTSFTGVTGSFKLYLDTIGDSTPVFGATGDISATAANNSDDILLASSTNLFYSLGQGVGSPTSSFKFLFDELSLTADGAQGNLYFTAPNPFYVMVDVNGDFDDGLLATTPGTYAGILGDVSASFQEVPEPGSLALLGLGIAGLGMYQRRRKASI